MPTMNIIQAVNDALRVEMTREPKVVVLGEDVGKFGGVFRATSGLHDEFGPERVIDTPLAEAGIIGTAIGMALYGLRPVPEIQFADFIFPAFDQIVNELAKFRYRSGGQYPCPVVIRTPYGGGIRGGHYHSQSPESLFIHIAGLKVVVPSNPYDAKGLLLSCMRQNDPVLFMEPKRIYRAARGEVPAEDYTVPLGQAKVVREGDQVTIISYGAMVPIAEEAAQKASEQSISCEVLDLRTLLPFDIDAILGLGQEDRARGHRARGAAHVRLRRGAGRDDLRARHRVPRGADPAGDRLRHAVPVQPRARVHAQCRSRADRGPRDPGVVTMAFEFHLPDLARA